jgi:hypothetical protein
MNKYIIKTVKIIIGVAIFAWFGIFLAHKIDLTTADLGRHIQNGRVIIHGSWQDKWAVLHTNFYSYTLPNQPFVNHHWLSGVVFYLIWKIVGFVGLSVWYVLFGLITLWLFFDVARKASNFWIASGATIVVVPLMASRAEVRPEMFSYFFTGVFFWLLWHWRVGKLAHNRLLVLPALMVLWVNLHIGFVFGFLVLGAFGLEQVIKLSQKKPNGFVQLLIISGLCLAAGLINPFGYKILIYPFLIFKNYGYLIVENQSVKFLENINFTAGQHFLLFKAMVGLALAGFIAVAITAWRKLDVAQLVVIVITGGMAYLAIRNFPSFAFFVLPAVAGNIYLFKPKEVHPAYASALALCGLAIVALSLFYQRQDFVLIKPALGFGLLPGVEASADFFKRNNIQGPIFNNYDVGGYLIYSLGKTNQHGSGQQMDTNEKVFVDNRPEAYSVDFFQNIYIPAQNDEQKWQELDARYDFNAIFFSYRDYTPWAQKFLINRVHDQRWAPVFVDAYNIIFVKINRQNLDVIRQFQLPKGMFTTSAP